VPNLPDLMVPLRFTVPVPTVGGGGVCMLVDVASCVSVLRMDMSARDLKLAIVDQRKLNNITEFDLSIKNQQTNQVYAV